MQTDNLTLEEKTSPILLAHHLQLAMVLFETIPDGEPGIEAVMEHLQVRGNTRVLARNFLQKLNDYYESLDGDIEILRRVTPEDYSIDDDGKVCSIRRDFFHCGEEWSDYWSCACNDECPTCGVEVEPDFWIDELEPLNRSE